MYCPQMRLGACHENKLVLKKKKIQKCTDFCDHALEKSAAPLKVK